MGSPAGGGGPDRGAGRWVEVCVAVAGRDAERVAAALGGLAPGGAAIEHGVRPGGAATGFSAAAAAGPAEVRVWLPVAAEAGSGAGREARAAAAAALAPLALEGAPEPRASLVEPPDWAREWRRFYRPVRAGRLVICPPWEPFPAGPGDVVIVIDPGRAFGTGHHESTRLCLRAVGSQLAPGTRVLDLGTGSGILAVAAARLGAASVRALDVDPVAVRVARESARRNGVAGRVVAAAGSLGREWPWAGSGRDAADLVLANLSRPLIESLAREIARTLRPAGVLVASGYLAREADAVGEALAAAGLRTLRVESEGEWCCHVALRDPRAGRAGGSLLEPAPAGS